MYDGDDEEKQKKGKNDLHPETKGNHESAMPDWKSSHAVLFFLNTFPFLKSKYLESLESILGPCGQKAEILPTAST